MKIESLVYYFIDNCVPPGIRDNKQLMSLLFKLVYKDKYSTYLNFKEKAYSLSDCEILNIYKELNIAHDKSFLSAALINKIRSSILGNSVLDVGCGNGHLCSLLCEQFKCYCCDIVNSTDYDITFFLSSAISLPLKDNCIDTVVCTHTLEHLINPFEAVKEFRRVAKKRIILLVPMQREYKYTFDLHLHFFPYPEAIQRITNYPGCTQLIHNEILYIEDILDN